MDRRTFVGSLALTTVVLPYHASAQPARKVYRIGLLGSLLPTADMVGPEPRNPAVVAFIKGLRELGYVYGEHFVTEPRGADGRFERFPALAAELSRLKVDVIVSAGPALPALKQAISTIPVVMAGAGDPVRQGFAKGLAHPDGNFTGLSFQLTETTAKRLELVKELVPGEAPVAIFWEARDRPLSLQVAESAARARGWKLLPLGIRDPGEIERAFRTATAARAGALLVVPHAVFDRNAPRIVELATKSRLPAVYAFRTYVEVGGLMSYGPDTVNGWRRAAFFVDKILKGARVADLPIEQSAKYELVINLRAARSIGLTIPAAILARADEVMQ